MITVVIPVRDRENLVGSTLQSLAEQTVSPEAVVLVDNGSADGSLHTLREWARGRDNVTVICHPKPGAAGARNAGMALVRTPYVMFFDSDDLMPSRHIEEIIRGLRSSGLPQIGAFDMDLIDLKGNRHPKPFRQGDSMRMQIFHSILSTQRCVINTDYARSVGGWNEALPGWNDWEFGVRLLRPNPTLAYLPLSRPVEAYAQVQSITGADFASKAGAWERALDAVEEALCGTKYAPLVNYRRAILAGMYRREGRADLAKGMARGLKFKMIERYVALGGRGVEQLARFI